MFLSRPLSFFFSSWKHIYKLHCQFYIYLNDPTFNCRLIPTNIIPVYICTYFHISLCLPLWKFLLYSLCVIRKCCICKICLSCVGVPERVKTKQITKRHLMQLRMKLDSIKESMKKIACNRNIDSKNCYAFVSSKQNV